MAAHGFIIWLIIGALAGWLAGLFVKGAGFGLLVDIVVGIAGAFVGGWLVGFAGLGSNMGFFGSLVTATLGAVILLVLLRTFKLTRK